MNPIVNYQNIPVNPPNIKVLHPAMAVVKTIFEVIAHFFARIAYGIYNAIQLSHLGSKLAKRESVTTYNDARSGMYDMFQRYTSNSPHVQKYAIHDQFYLDFNRSYMRANDLEGTEENLDAFVDELAQIAGSRKGVHMITRILHQALPADVIIRTVTKLDQINLKPHQFHDDYLPAFIVQKNGNNIEFIAGAVWRNTNARDEEDDTTLSYSYNIQKVIVPASKIGNIQSPLDFRTEEYYSPLFATKDKNGAVVNAKDAVMDAFYQEINVIPE